MGRDFACEYSVIVSTTYYVTALDQGEAEEIAFRMFSADKARGLLTMDTEACCELELDSLFACRNCGHCVDHPNAICEDCGYDPELLPSDWNNEDQVKAHHERLLLIDHYENLSVRFTEDDNNGC